MRSTRIGPGSACARVSAKMNGARPNDGLNRPTEVSSPSADACAPFIAADGRRRPPPGTPPRPGERVVEQLRGQTAGQPEEHPGERLGVQLVRHLTVRLRLPDAVRDQVADAAVGRGHGVGDAGFEGGAVGEGGRVGGGRTRGVRERQQAHEQARQPGGQCRTPRLARQLADGRLPQPDEHGAQQFVLRGERLLHRAERPARLRRHRTERHGPQSVPGEEREGGVRELALAYGEIHDPTLRPRGGSPSCRPGWAAILRPNGSRGPT